MSFSEWKKYKLGDFADVQNGYAFRADDFSDFGIPVIKIKNIVSPNINVEDAQCFNGEITSRLRQFMVKKDDILISMTGSHINQIASAVAKVGKYQFEKPALLNQRVGKIFVSDKTIGDEKYLFYYLSRYETQYELASSAGGSANQANISPTQIKNLKIELPPLSVQQTISSILSSLDDKIELNRQMGQTLEAIAQTLFKEMCLPKGDELPDGWKVCTISEMGKIVCGKTPSKNVKEYFGDEILFIKIPNMHNKVFITSTEEMLTKAGAESQKNKYIPAFSILVSCIATVGLVSIASELSQTNQQINSIIPQNKSDTYFLYFKLKSLQTILKDLGSGGSATLNVNTTTFSNILIELPTLQIRRSFQNLTNPIFDRILNIEHETQTLSSLRDGLLPKLMKGEICL